MEREDPLRPPDRLREVPLRPSQEGLDLLQLAVFQDDRLQLQLVPKRLDRVRRGKRVSGGSRVARHRPDLEPVRIDPETSRSRRG